MTTKNKISLPSFGSATFEISSNMFGGYLPDSSESGSIMVDVKGRVIELFRAGFVLNVLENELIEITKTLFTIGEDFNVTAFYPYNVSGLTSQSPGTNQNHYTDRLGANAIAAIYRSNATFKGVPLTKFLSNAPEDIALKADFENGKT